MILYSLHKSMRREIIITHQVAVAQKNIQQLKSPVKETTHRAVLLAQVLSHLFHRLGKVFLIMMRNAWRNYFQLQADN